MENIPRKSRLAYRFAATSRQEKDQIIIHTIMTTIAVGTPAGKASTVKSAFSRETSVSISIGCRPTVIWALLTNAADYPDGIQR